MLLSEFENLTGIYPSMTLYNVIERHYNESKADKHDFCRAYLENVDGIAEKIQREANHAELDAEALKYRMTRLQAELDKELDWKHVEGTGTNMTLADYEQLASSPGVVHLDDDEAKELISEVFGFMPERIEIIRKVETFEVNKYHRFRVEYTFQREPLYQSSDWYYIRFNCSGNQWEIVNGELLPYDD